MRTNAIAVMGAAGCLLLSSGAADAASSTTTITVTRAEMLTVDVLKPVTLDLQRASIQAKSATVLFFRRTATTDPGGGLALLPELDEAEQVTLGGAKHRLTAGRYEFSVLATGKATIRLPLGSSALRIARRRGVARPAVTVTDLTSPTGAAAGHWQQPTTLRAGTLVLGILYAQLTSPVAAESLEVCVAPSALPCSAQYGYGISTVNTRSTPVEETVFLIFEDTPTTTSERIAQASVLGADTVPVARAMLFSGPLR